MNPVAHHVFMHRIDSKSDVDVQKVPCSNLHFYSLLLPGLHLRRDWLTRLVLHKCWPESSCQSYWLTGEQNWRANLEYRPTHRRATHSSRGHSHKLGVRTQTHTQLNLGVQKVRDSLKSLLKRPKEAHLHACDDNKKSADFTEQKAKKTNKMQHKNIVTHAQPFFIIAIHFSLQFLGCQ